MRPQLPPHFASKVVVWDDHHARFRFAVGSTEPPGTPARWLLALSPLLFGLIVWLGMSGSMHYGNWIGATLATAGVLSTGLLCRRIRPWIPIARDGWQENFWRQHEVWFDFDHGMVRDGQGKVFACFEDLELAIHVGQCFGEALFTVLVPGNPEGDGWYLAVLDQENSERTFLGPGTLAEIEHVGLHLLRHYPFRLMRNYVATLRGADGKEQPSTTYIYERQST